mgnify:CR=1 FL=1
MCMEAFMIGHHDQVEKGNKKYLMLILAENLKRDNLTPELSIYLDSNIFIDARKLVQDAEAPDHDVTLQQIRKEIHYHMPGG